MGRAKAARLRQRVGMNALQWQAKPMEDEIIFFSQWCKDWLQDIERAFFDEEGAESKTEAASGSSRF